MQEYVDGVLGHATAMQNKVPHIHLLGTNNHPNYSPIVTPSLTLTLSQRERGLK